MTPHDLIEAFEALTEAPEGVVRLRELILRLAVRGHLVPQDPADEPATELVQRARAEQSTLVSSKAIPAPPPTVEIGAEDAPYEVPCGWVWAPLGHVVAVLDFMRRPIKEEERDVRIFGKPQSALYPYYGATQQVGWIDEYIFDEELVLLGEDGAPFFKPGKDVAYVVSGRYWVNNHAHALRGLGILNPYLRSVLNQTPYDGFVSGTTRPKLTQGKMVQLPVPVPPLAEQHRIVARVDELMALLDRLEAARTTRETTRDAVRNSALAALREADAPEEVEVAWNRFAERMDDLVIDPSDIAPLRQAVLELAVRGRLVLQDPSDEPASTLLDRVQTEPHQPFKLPGSWVWTTLDDLCDPERQPSYGVLVPGPDIANGVPLVRVAELSACRPPLRPEKSISATVAEQYERVRLRGDELLVGVVGSIGKIGVARPEWEGAVVARAVARFAVKDMCLRGYMLLVLMSPFAQAYFREATRTLAQPTLNVGQLRRLPVPLPPLAEQQRIVTRVDAMTNLLAQLEERLAATRSAHAAFAAAAVHHLDARARQ